MNQETRNYDAARKAVEEAKADAVKDFMEIAIKDAKAKAIKEFVELIKEDMVNIPASIMQHPARLRMVRILDDRMEEVIEK